MRPNEQQQSKELCKTNDRTTLRCAWPWLSGFLAAPAFIHLVRALAGWRLVIGGVEISINTSWIFVFVFGILAFVCGVLGCMKKPL